MLTIRSLANALMQTKRNRSSSIRERIARGALDYETTAKAMRGKASASTIRKWRRTHEAREAGWLDAKA
jgi:hypothetical protein